MIQHFKRKFQVTDEGAHGLLKASFLSLCVYIVSMFPVMIIMFVGDMLLSGNKHESWLYIVSAVVTLIALAIALAIEYESTYNATYKESACLRIGIAKRLKSLPLSFFSKRNLSDLSQSIMSDVETIEHAISHSIPKIYAIYFFLPLLSVMLMAGNVWLGLAVIAPNILRFLVLPLYKRQVERGNKKFYKVLREQSEKFQEVIELNQEIKGFNLSQDIKRNLYEKMDYSERMHLLAEVGNVQVMGLSSLFSFISLGVVLVVGTQLLATGSITMLYLLGYMLAAIKVKEIVDISNESTLEILFVAPRVANLKEINETAVQEGVEVELKSFDVDLTHVGFAYDKDTPVLSDVSFAAKQGEVTALVGVSGCGKTTLLKLISRLYDYDSGHICVDGKDIKGISTDSLFDKTSIVFQDVTLFNSSIKENIRIGKLDATDDEVRHAAQLANCMEFIDRLPDGFNSTIGENGVELSGGERQRLSIARAFLKDAPILILDEIAASLDIENERKIQESLSRLIENKTVVVISHRLKSVETVDKIVVLNDGKVEAVGTHTELLKTSATYKNLIEKSKLAEEFVY